MKTIAQLNEAEILSIKRRKQKGTKNKEIAEIIGCPVSVVIDVLKSK